MVPTSNSTVPYLWVASEDAAAVQTALQRSEFVEEVRLVDETGPETLFRVEWSSEVNGLLDIIEESEAAVLEAEGLGDDWSFRMRFSDRRSLSEFYQTCVDSGVTPRLDEVNDLLGSTGDSELNLTELQREALLAALEMGYFDVPRKITLQDLADELGISDTALSQRLQRGLSALLSSTLSPPRQTDD